MVAPSSGILFPIPIPTGWNTSSLTDVSWEALTNVSSWKELTSWSSYNITSSSHVWNVTASGAEAMWNATTSAGATFAPIIKTGGANVLSMALGAVGFYYGVGTPGLLDNILVGVSASVAPQYLSADQKIIQDLYLVVRMVYYCIRFKCVILISPRFDITLLVTAISVLMDEQFGFLTFEKIFFAYIQKICIAIIIVVFFWMLRKKPLNVTIATQTE